MKNQGCLACNGFCAAVLNRIFSIIHNLKRNVAEKLLTSGRNPVEHNFDSTHNDDIVAEEIDQMDESVILWVCTSHHLCILLEVVESSSVNDALVPFHKRIYNGCAANLTSRATKDCGSWNLMGFSEAVKRNPTVESAAIIAVDSGIWPELESFNDEDLGTISPEEVEGCL
ncbi:hypothetical protein WN943_026739 [Citrus x changshan-huyou]